MSNTKNIKSHAVKYHGWNLVHQGKEWIASFYDQQKDTHYRVEAETLSQIKSTINIFMKESDVSQRKAA